MKLLVVSWKKCEGEGSEDLEIMKLLVGVVMLLLYLNYLHLNMYPCLFCYTSSFSINFIKYDQRPFNTFRHRHSLMPYISV